MELTREKLTIIQEAPESVEIPGPLTHYLLMFIFFTTEPTLLHDQVHNLAVCIA